MPLLFETTRSEHKTMGTLERTKDRNLSFETLPLPSPLPTATFKLNLRLFHYFFFLFLSAPFPIRCLFVSFFFFFFILLLVLHFTSTFLLLLPTLENSSTPFTSRAKCVRERDNISTDPTQQLTLPAQIITTTHSHTCTHSTAHPQQSHHEVQPALPPAQLEHGFRPDPPLRRRTIHLLLLLYSQQTYWTQLFKCCPTP